MNLVKNNATLVSSLESLKSVLEAVDLVEQLTPEKADEVLIALAPKLDSSLDDFKERVDARINFLEYLDIMEKKFKSDMEYYQNKMKSCELLKQRLKTHTLILMKENPGIPFEGEKKKFRVQKNGGKAPTEWKAKLSDQKNIVDPTEVSLFPEGMVKEVRLFVLDKEKFEAFLNSGGISEAAKLLDRGEHIRIV